jgi:hypothetical protein
VRLESFDSYSEIFSQVLSLDDDRVLRIMLQPDHPFAKKNQWQFIFAFDQNLKVLGQVFVSGSLSKKFFFFGYFQAQDVEVSRSLLQCAWEWGRERGFVEMRGPVQAHIFNGSRITVSKIESVSVPGEPVYPLEYNEYFLRSGLVVDRYWKTMTFPRFLIYLHFVVGFLSFKKFYRDLRIVEVDFSDPREAPRFYSMLYEVAWDAYRALPDFTDFSYDEFMLWSGPFLASLEPRYSLLALHHGEPVAFLLSKECNRRIHILHLGKKKSAEGKLRGITGFLLARLFRVSFGFVKGAPYSCYVADDSPAYKILVKLFVKEVAKYAIYRRSV